MSVGARFADYDEVEAARKATALRPQARSHRHRASLAATHFATTRRPPPRSSWLRRRLQLRLAAMAASAAAAATAAAAMTGAVAAAAAACRRQCAKPPGTSRFTARSARKAARPRPSRPTCPLGEAIGPRHSNSRSRATSRSRDPSGVWRTSTAPFP